MLDLRYLQILKAQTVGKQCRTWSGSALFADVP